MIYSNLEQTLLDQITSLERELSDQEKVVEELQYSLENAERDHMNLAEEFRELEGELESRGTVVYATMDYRYERMVVKGLDPDMTAVEILQELHDEWSNQ